MKISSSFQEHRDNMLHAQKDIESENYGQWKFLLNWLAHRRSTEMPNFGLHNSFLRHPVWAYDILSGKLRRVELGRKILVVTKPEC